MAQLDEGCVGVNFLEKLQSHKGCLIHLKTQLYWYDGQGWDNNPGRICLLLDATATATAATVTAAAAASATTVTACATGAAFLLIDGSSKWIWIDEQDIDLLVNDPPTN